MSHKTPRTIISFVDRQDPTNALAHQMREIHINGTAVLVAEDGIDLEFSDKDLTAITLRILPTEVHFISLPNEEDAA